MSECDKCGDEAAPYGMISLTEWREYEHWKPGPVLCKQCREDVAEYIRHGQ